MERTTHRASRDSNALAFDEPQGNPQPAYHTPAPSTDPSSDDPIPLFLSELRREPDPQELAPRASSKLTSIVTRIVAGGLAVLACAILVAVLNSDVTRALVSNSDVTRFLIDKARVPIGGASKDRSADQSATQGAAKEPAVRQVLLKDPAPVSGDPAPVSDPVPQSQVPAARAGNEAAAPSKKLDAETLAALMTRARSMLTLGDIAAARLLLERAATSQDATAAFLLAQTYDPAVLGVRDTRSIAPDPVVARDWYRKAASFGSAAAQQRLTQFQN
ncbi:hypothetical protein KIP88_14170 [Bradyrhizobium sp. SRL28]|nr:hypothetical protein [Bradyrhizobium sp. SRL28]